MISDRRMICGHTKVMEIGDGRWRWRVAIEGWRFGIGKLKKYIENAKLVKADEGCGQYSEVMTAAI